MSILLLAGPAILLYMVEPWCTLSMIDLLIPFCQRAINNMEGVVHATNDYWWMHGLCIIYTTGIFINTGLIPTYARYCIRVAWIVYDMLQDLYPYASPYTKCAPKATSCYHQKKTMPYATNRRTTKVIYNSYTTQQLRNCINPEVHQGAVVFQLQY